MNPLQIIEIRLDLPALMRFIQTQGLDAGRADEDLGYGLHAWMAAAFGPLAPKPWRLLMDRVRPARILGYAPHGADRLRQRFREFAEPGVFAVCPDPDTGIASKQMPFSYSGRHLAFEVQCCPVGRKADSGVEKDLFLICADAAGSAPLDRAAVYAEWARERFERNEAASVAEIYLAGFRLVRLTRQARTAGGERRRKHLVRPQALLRGRLTVRDPVAFQQLLATGIGRHRAFGYGMVLLRPPS